MAGMQLRSFLMEVARNSHRPPKAFFFEMAPWQLRYNNGKQQTHSTLDTIMEEDVSDSFKIHASASVSEPSSSSSLSLFFQDFQKGAFARCD
ncbi:hypothetical protein KFK09_025259 [Dendrobium nobile]|uniref:Uncharacterized protein n=1 Tax=Dendrobium nobile TaxID=94219 RepID=A0A8T3AH87_DENNO|nr:hypothetical protein KFK09_025259 [Dendrobium nobile]